MDHHQMINFAALGFLRNFLNFFLTKTTYYYSVFLYCWYIISAGFYAASINF